MWFGKDARENSQRKENLTQQKGKWSKSTWTDTKCLKTRMVKQNKIVSVQKWGDTITTVTI